MFRIGRCENVDFWILGFKDPSFVRPKLLKYSKTKLIFSRNGEQKWMFVKNVNRVMANTV